MQTLEECYKEIAKDHDRWSYYDQNSPDICNTWENEERVYKFIKDYFTYAGKSEVVTDEHLRAHKGRIEGRAPHIISTFLLGIKIAESFGIDITTRNSNSMNFKYYWFLTCLYHDFGYAYESAPDCKGLTKVRVNGIDALKEICDLQHTMATCEFQTYPKGIVDFYLKYRAADCAKLDHGIVGGLLLYDKLKKQFYMAQQNENIQLCAEDKSSFLLKQPDGHTLCWSVCDFAAYAKAADAIISHNIWKKTLKDFYKKYETDEGFSKADQGIIMSDEKITLSDNELGFILAIADTIEPLKKNVPLDSFMIESLPGGEKGFELHINKGNINLDTSKGFIDNIKSLKDWVDVDVEVPESNDDCAIVKIASK